MAHDEKITLAKRLFRKGKFEQRTTKNMDRFEPLDTDETLPYKERELDFYYDTEKDMIVAGSTAEGQTENTFFYLAFSPYEYRFNEQSSFEWYDVHTVSRKDLKKKK